MVRHPKHRPCRARLYRPSWDWLEDRCLLSGGLFSAAPVPAVQAVLPAAPALVNLGTPNAAPVLVAPDPAATPSAPASAPVADASGGTPAGVLGRVVPVLGQVEQTASAAPLNAGPAPSGGAAASFRSGGLRGGGPLLVLSASAGLGSGGSSGSGAQLGARVGLPGNTDLGVSAGASLGQDGAGLDVAVGSTQPDAAGSTHPDAGLGVNVGVDPGGSQLVSLAITTDVQPGPSGGTGSGGSGTGRGGAGLTLDVGGLGVGGGVDLNLGGTDSASVGLGAPGSLTSAPGPGGGSLLGGDLAVGVGDHPVVSIPPLIGGGLSTDEGGSGRGAGQVFPVAQTSAVAAALSGVRPEAGGAVSGDPATRAAAPLSRELFLAPDAAGAGGELPTEAAATPAVDRLVENAEADTFVADLALWGAADGTLWTDSLTPELPAPVVSPRVTSGGAAASAEVLAPDGAVALPASQEAGLLTACVPYDVGSLDAAFRRLLDQLQSLGGDFAGLLARLQGTPWVLALAAMAVTCEACRRRLARARNRLAAAGGAGASLTWFPSSSAGSGDEG